MKNFKKIALGLIVGALAIGFSAFTNIKTKTNLSERYWTNDGTNYNLVTSYDLDDCTGTNSHLCVVESTDAMIPAQFSNSNPSGYPISGVAGASDAQYVDE